MVLINRVKQYYKTAWFDPDDNSLLNIAGVENTSKYLNPTTFSIRDLNVLPNDAALRTMFQDYLMGCKIFVPILNAINQTFVCALCKPGFLTINDTKTDHTIFSYKTTLFDLVGKSKSILSPTIFNTKSVSSVIELSLVGRV